MGLGLYPLPAIHPLLSTPKPPHWPRRLPPFTTCGCCLLCLAQLACCFKFSAFGSPAVYPACCCIPSSTSLQPDEVCVGGFPIPSFFFRLPVPSSDWQHLFSSVFETLNRIRGAADALTSVGSIAGAPRRPRPVMHGPPSRFDAQHRFCCIAERLYVWETIVTHPAEYVRFWCPTRHINAPRWAHSFGTYSSLQWRTEVGGAP